MATPRTESSSGILGRSSGFVSRCALGSMNAMAKRSLRSVPFLKALHFVGSCTCDEFGWWIELGHRGWALQAADGARLKSMGCSRVKLQPSWADVAQAPLAFLLSCQVVLKTAEALISAGRAESWV